MKVRPTLRSLPSGDKSPGIPSSIRGQMETAGLSNLNASFLLKLFVVQLNFTVKWELKVHIYRSGDVEIVASHTVG